MLFGIIKRNKFVIEEGSHTENVLIIVLEGSFELTINQKKTIVHEKSVLYFEKGVSFKRHILQPLKIIYVQYVNTLPFTSGVLSYKDVFRKNSTISLLYDAVKNNQNDLCEHFAIDLAAQSFSEIQQHYNSVSNETLAFYDFVSENYKESISIKQFADHVHMTHTGFLLKFKKETGKTPTEYICTYRLNLATDLLFNTTLSISEIAEKCGFENLYYFSNCFKKHYHISPSKYRKNNL